MIREFCIVLYERSVMIYEDYSIREIAQQLKLNEGNVKVRLSRARQILKEQLKENWNNEE